MSEQNQNKKASIPIDPNLATVGKAIWGFGVSYWIPLGIGFISSLLIF
jgi:hypothetical protein